MNLYDHDFCFVVKKTNKLQLVRRRGLLSIVVIVIKMIKHKIRVRKNAEIAVTAYLNSDTDQIPESGIPFCLSSLGQRLPRTCVSQSSESESK